MESLREWVLQEAEFQTKALEAVYGLTNTRQGQLETRRSRRENPHTYFGRPNVTESGTERQNLRVCKVCSKSHGAWACPEFKQMEIQNRWDCAKKHKLCFRCLGDGHLGQFCNRTRVCGIDNCKQVHHFTKPVMFCQVLVVIVEEQEMKRKKNLLRRMTPQKIIVIIMKGSQKISQIR